MKLEYFFVAVAAAVAVACAPAYADGCTDMGRERGIIVLMVKEKLGTPNIDSTYLLAREMMDPRIFGEVAEHDPVLAGALLFLEKDRERCPFPAS
jgi:hypothetical protein